MGIQRLNKVVTDQYSVAKKYYQILLNAVNDLSLADKEIELIAFAAVKGNITDAGVREEFCSKYNTTVATINNMVWRLKKKNIFHKKGKELFINPVLTKLDFSTNTTLVISIELVPFKDKDDEQKV